MLSGEQVRRMIDWLDLKGASKNCIACGSTDFHVLELVG